MTGWVAPRQWEAVVLSILLESHSFPSAIYTLLVICCDLHADPWVLILEVTDPLAKEFVESKRNRLRPDQETDMLHNFTHRVLGTSETPRVNSLRVTTADGRWKIQAKRVNEIFPDISPTREVSSLYFEFEER